MSQNTKMGRPKKFENRTTMSFDLDMAMLNEITSCARERGQTKSEFVRLAIAHELFRPARVQDE